MGIINELSGKLIDFLIGLLKGFPNWIQVLIVAGIAILVFFGIIYFIKKSWKILVTIVSIALAGLIIYWFFLK